MDLPGDRNDRGDGGGPVGGGGRPDRGGDQLGLEDGVPCPFCDGTDTELHNPFGSQLSLATYWCRSCHTAFERLKWRRR